MHLCKVFNVLISALYVHNINREKRSNSLCIHSLSINSSHHVLSFILKAKDPHFSAPDIQGHIISYLNAEYRTEDRTNISAVSLFFLELN